MTDAAGPLPDATAITAQAIEDKLAAGTPIEAAEVRWLLDALRSATASADAGTAGPTDAATPATPDSEPHHHTSAGSVRRPTREELIAEFRLGSDPSPDMLAYLAEYVVERDAEAAAEAAGSATES